MNGYWLVLTLVPLFLDTVHAVHVPLLRQKSPRKLSKRGEQTAAIGLGDYLDVTYNVMLTVGNTTTPLVLDTGSSDLWVISDACVSDCETSLSLYPQASFESTGLEARLLYGDSLTGTHAFGLIGKDTVNLAGLVLQDQYFAAINDTNTSVLDAGSAGIFGLGFPINSVIWAQVFSNEQRSGSPGRRKRGRRLDNHISRPSNNYGTRIFPHLKPPTSSSSSSVSARQDDSLEAEWTSRILSSYLPHGPLLPRLALSSSFPAPMFSVTLQRNYVDIGGNLGLLSVGELPPGVSNSSLTWVPIRAYTPDEGGLPAPSESPDEVYPMAWEVFIDAVYLDGERLPDSTLSSNISPSALIDTGNSLIRGPPDVVEAIYNRLGGSEFACATPHRLSFEIGGERFDVDPRDFVSQAYYDTVERCVSNVVVTDTPVVGEGYLYSWSLGDPFLKSVLSAFYYGNITYPSQDASRLGFLSTVPDDADDRYRAAVQNAEQNLGGNFPETSQPPPTGTPTAGGTNADGVPAAEETSPSQSDSGSNSAGAPLILKPLSRLESWLAPVVVTGGAYLWG